jgi:uncharacterized membrane protein
VKQATLDHMATGGVTLATSSGVVTSYLGWLGHYAAGIGVVCTIFFGLVYCVFHVLAYKKSTLADENKRQLELIKAQVVNNMSEVKAGLKAIEAAINKQNKGN